MRSSVSVNWLLKSTLAEGTVVTVFGHCRTDSESFVLLSHADSTEIFNKLFHRTATSMHCIQNKKIITYWKWNKVKIIKKKLKNITFCPLQRKSHLRNPFWLIGIVTTFLKRKSLITEEELFLFLTIIIMYYLLLLLLLCTLLLFTIYYFYSHHK